MRSIGFALVVLSLAGCASTSSSVDNATSEVTVTAPAGFQQIEIKGEGGVVLKANVIEPEGEGPHPAIVLPSSWGLFDVEYVVQAKKLAHAGYVVLSYTPRGFWASEGEIDTAGPKDVADSKLVIDWLVANTSADSNHIGMAGVSYGAGISLLSAAFDPRIKSVAALSGWTDLVGSLFASDTRRAQTVAMLALVAKAVGHTSEEFEGIVADFKEYRNVEELKAWGRVRSPSTYLSALNRNRPAILIANAYGDSIFPPNQLVDIFPKLEGPKRLELRPGDHAIPEATGLVGLSNDVWDSMRAWMDAHLKGVGSVENGIELHSMTSESSELLPSWSAAFGSKRRYPINWQAQRASITKDTIAHGGVVLVSGALDALTGVPPLAEISLVDRNRSAVWTSPPGALRIRGIPSVHLSITPSQSRGTLVSYLYDVDAFGMGKLITHGPASWLGATASAERTLDIDLPAIDYDVDAGHRLALVVDGKDALYLDENEEAASAVVFGTSSLELPLR